MSETPFPSDPNAEVCVHTGAKAYAVVGRYGRNRVSGWYGSTVIDGETFLVTDPDFPEGPICDAALREALDGGRVFDPSPVLSGDLPLAQVPDAVIAGLIDLGIDNAKRHLADSHGVPSGMSIPPMIDAEADDPLSRVFMAGLMGQPRNPGPDLEGVGMLLEVLHRARGRKLEGEDRVAAVRGVVDRIRGEEAFIRALQADIGDRLA